MTIPQNSNKDLISLKDLINTKMCPDCCHPLRVKQITLDEACRACFNEECHTQSLEFPIIEYIQRSYRDLEIEESGQAFSNIPVSLEEEMEKIDKLFCEVESMVSHRLSEEEKNELKLLSISQSQTEELNSANITKESSYDNPEFQIGCTDESSVNFKTGDAPILHFIQPNIISSGIMTEVSAFDILQIEENVSHQCPSTFIENSGIVYDEQLPRSETTNLSEMLPYHYEAKAEDIDFEIVSRVSNNILDLNPHQERISCGILTSSLNTIVDSNDNLQLLNDDVSASDIESQNSEIIQIQASQSELFQAEDKNRVENDNYEKETAFNEDKSACNTDEAEDFDFRVNVTNRPRCYIRPRPRREQRTVKVETETKVPLNCNVFNKWSDMSDTLKFELSHSPVSDEVCKTNDEYELFKDVDVCTDSQRSTSLKPSTLVKSEQNGGVCVSTLSQKSKPFSNDTNEMLHKGQSFITITLEDSQSINCAEGASADVTENIQFISKGKNGATPKTGCSKKVLVPKTDSATLSSSRMASLTLNDVPVPKVSSKAALGFNELRNFGGAKCSLPAQKKTAKPVVKKSKKRKGNAKKTLSSVSNDAINVDAEIEKAIENIQNTNGSELADWESELIEFLK